MDGGAPRTPADALAAVRQSPGVRPIYVFANRCNGGLFAAKWRFDSCCITTGGLAHGILAFRTSGSAAMTRRADGEVIRKRPAIGSVSFVSADTCAHWIGEGPSEALHIYIPQALARRFAEQELDAPSAPRIADFFAIVEPWLQGYFRMLTSELEIFAGSGDGPDPLFLGQTEHLLLRHLLRRHSSCAKSGQLDGLDLRHALNPLQSSTMRRVQEYIETHLAEEICLQDLADVAFMSPGHFLRGFRVGSGTTPYQYVLEQRLQKARAMLTCGAEPISRIAMQCGFKTLSHMSSKFRGRFGMSPSTYRAQRARRTNVIDLARLGHVPQNPRASGQSPG